jgi:hypothetical protein
MSKNFVEPHLITAVLVSSDRTNMYDDDDDEDSMLSVCGA